MSARPTSAQEVAARLADRIESLVVELLPQGHREGAEWRCGSINGESGKSLGVHLTGEKRGVWADFANGERGDALELVKAVLGLDTRAAIEWSLNWLGERATDATSPPTVKRGDEWKPILPVPKDAARRMPWHPEHGRPSGRWPYRDAEGQLLGLTCRFNRADGGKVVLPLTFCEGPDGRREWRWQSFPPPRPLYGLDLLAQRPDAQVIVVEGEKATNAAQERFPDHVAITWPGGAKAVSKADWTPLKGRRVTVWPDNDPEGRKAAKAVARASAEVGPAEVRIVELPADFSPKWDLADPLPEGWPVERLRQLIERAPVFDEKPATRLRADTVSGFLSLDLPPREMVLDPCIPTQGLVMLYASRGVGKTYLALGIAYAVATGCAFLRWKAPKPRRVLFIDGEMPAATMQERTAQIVAAGDVEPPGPDFLRIVTPDRQDLGMPDLATVAGQDTIEEILGDAELVILDNLSALCREGKENEGESWLPVQDWALKLRRRGVSVLFVHHAGKSGQQRGTSRREDVLDTVVCLKRPPDYVETEGARFEVRYEKLRAIAGEDARPFEAKLETRDGKALWTTKDLEDSRAEQVAELLNEGFKQKDIAEMLGVHPSNVSRAKKRARELGLLTGAGP